MLQELALALPKFDGTTKLVEPDIRLESALVDVFAELIVFCAEVIRYFRLYYGHRE